MAIQDERARHIEKTIAAAKALVGDLEKAADNLSDAWTDAAQELAELERNLVRLLDLAGDRGECRSCGARIWWIKSKAGRNMPITAAGILHFADCPNANQHRKT